MINFTQWNRNLKEKKVIRQIWHLEIFHIIECFQVEKSVGGVRHDVWNIRFSFQKKKNFFVVK